MTLDDFVRRADELIQLEIRVEGTARAAGMGFTFVDNAGFGHLRAASLAFLRNVFGEQHPFFTDFNTHVVNAKPNDVTRAKGILIAAQAELAGGWFQTTRGLISAEIFSDFLEMSEHLLDENYKDPAAVMAGSVLEEHLRQLAIKHNISLTVNKNGEDVPRSADALNADLAKTAYDKNEQKSVTAWLGLRNDAAHGHYTKYEKSQVVLMVAGIRDFITRRRF